MPNPSLSSNVRRLLKAFRLVLSGILAGIAAALVPVLISMLVLSVDNGLDILGRSDDAPSRAAGVVIRISPVLALVLGIIVAAIAASLRYLRLYSLKTLLGCTTALSLVVGVYFAVSGYLAFGLRDAFISLATFWILCSGCLALGGLTWWLFSSWRDA